MLYKERTGTKYFSSILDNKTIEMKLTQKWKSILNLEINQNTWKNIFMIFIKSFKIINVNGSNTTKYIEY